MSEIFELDWDECDAVAGGDGGGSMGTGHRDGGGSMGTGHRDGSDPAGTGG